MQSRLRQEQLWVLGSRHILTRCVLVIVSLMGHVAIWGCVPDIRESFKIKSWKSRCQRGLSRFISHYLFFCVFSCTRCRFSSKLGVCGPRRQEELWNKALCVLPRKTSDWLEERLTLQWTKAVSMHGDTSIFSCTGHGVCLYTQCNVSGTWVSKSICNSS